MAGLMFKRLAALAATLLMLTLPNWAHARAQQFPSADAAADAFVDALARSDGDAMRQILGPGYHKVLDINEVAQHDKLDFLAAWAKTHRVVTQGDTVAMLEVGDSKWTLPIPMVKGSGGWSFDTLAGADEIKTRRIGRNELAAMEAVLAYFDAQKEYAQRERQPGQGLVYAQRFFSQPGKKDGLYWDTGADEAPSPLGPGYDVLDRNGAYHGYFYRILTRQGPNANGGTYDYRTKGRMNAGFALIAWPARWGYTGVMSFMVNHDGVVFEKNLGANTDKLARGMQSFDPDSSWTAVVPASVLADGGTKK